MLEGKTCYTNIASPTATRINRQSFFFSFFFCPCSRRLYNQTNMTVNHNVFCQMWAIQLIVPQSVEVLQRSGRFDTCYYIMPCTMWIYMDACLCECICLLHYNSNVAYSWIYKSHCSLKRCTCVIMPYYQYICGIKWSKNNTDNNVCNTQYFMGQYIT